MFNKVLVANRGEIAARIVSTLQDHGIEAYVTASDADSKSEITRKADGVIHLEGYQAIDTYLSIEKIVKKAKTNKIDAIHPGYGFLAENPDFAQKVIDAGMTFIGPTPYQMKSFGDKIEARKLAIKTDTPLIQGTKSEMNDEEIIEKSKEIGFPILIKAAAGGGGRGIRLVNKKEEITEQLQNAKTEAKLAFNDDRVYIEKYIPYARHIEVQVIGRGNGEILHFFERDCTMQRKNQKLIEEAPASIISRNKANEIHETAINLLSEIKYKNAGTVEFLMDLKDHSFYFMEVNARIQVEHPVSEMITGEDLIWRQIQVAAQEDLNLDQKDINYTGHAMEARINAENPYMNFNPSPGKINKIRHPIGAGVRVDSGISDYDEITSFYDPMISKVIVHSPNREATIRKMIHTLDNYIITGVHTTVPFIKNLISEKDFLTNNYHTKYLDSYKTSIPEEIINIARIVAGFSFNRSGENKDRINGKMTSSWKLSALPQGN